MSIPKELVLIPIGFGAYVVAHVPMQSSRIGSRRARNLNSCSARKSRKNHYDFRKRKR